MTSATASAIGVKVGNVFGGCYFVVAAIVAGVIVTGFYPKGGEICKARGIDRGTPNPFDLKAGLL